MWQSLICVRGIHKPRFHHDNHTVQKLGKKKEYCILFRFSSQKHAECSIGEGYG